jgi:glycosyltransferase involved in cell wall biosynthesis
MSYALADVDLSQPLPAVALGPDQTGIGLVVRWQGELIGFAMLPRAAGAGLAPPELEQIARERFAEAVLKVQTEQALQARWAAPPAGEGPSLTIAICTKDRAARLDRLLGSLQALPPSPFPTVEILVVDNAPSDDATRRVVAARAGVRYLTEPKAGLDFARNAALQNASGDWLAFLDDDVVVDRNYLQGLHRAWGSCPDAGGMTGLVLPYRLDSEAQIRFEAGGGFGRGFRRTRFHRERWGNRLHPVGAGILGAGCNMGFDRKLLLDIGGFDEALDTGAPLPGGGDLDIFYRVLRTGRPIVYEPTYAVFHEHRETLAQLKRQYWTWGLGFMAFLTKSRRTDRDLSARHLAMVWWWLGDRLAAVARSGVRGRRIECGFAWAELSGGVQGWFGEYDRSAARSAAIRELRQ